MEDPPRYGLEQARNKLPHIVAEAHAGATTIIARHGRPYAAVVPIEALGRLEQATRRPPGALLALAGTGKGLWGEHSGETLAQLREDWSRR